MGHYEFELKPLPYAYEALEPYIDSLTMHLHHDRHLKTYVDNLNATLKPYPDLQSWHLEDLIKNVDNLPAAITQTVRNNAGGVYNHNFYFKGMEPQNKKNLAITQWELIKKINESFGGFEHFKAQFKSIALDVFGSGYAWLVLDSTNNLKIIKTANQDTPLNLGECSMRMNDFIPATSRDFPPSVVIKPTFCPIICIDVWEHAYYLKNYNLRANYINNWFAVVNWQKADEIYKTANKSR